MYVYVYIYIYTYIHPYICVYIYIYVLHVLHDPKVANLQLTTWIFIWVAGVKAPVIGTSACPVRM